MSTVHWLGSGLSATPGIQRLCRLGIPIIVYDPSPASAHRAVAPFLDQNHVQSVESDWTSCLADLSPGDVVVSMLPASLHDVVAKYCLVNSAHFVTASYCSEGIDAMQSDVLSKELRFISEIGLDPGIDHLFAHKLVDNYCHSNVYHHKNRIRFTS
ncbi:MAG: saccharopine dehydrogenase NADP-binding domain-containing protein, partial [Granulosicoccus sp.]